MHYNSYNIISHIRMSSRDLHTSTSYTQRITLLQKKTNGVRRRPATRTHTRRHTDIQSDRQTDKWQKGKRSNSSSGCGGRQMRTYSSSSNLTLCYVRQHSWCQPHRLTWPHRYKPRDTVPPEVAVGGRGDATANCSRLRRTFYTIACLNLTSWSHLATSISR